MLTVIELSHTKSRKSYWKCLCDCGNYKIVRSDSLKDGSTKSCSCLNYKPKQIKHGLHGTKLYQVWASMKYRCNNINDSHYHLYGGRGITYCKDWEDYLPFHEWAMINGYKEGLTIDRINNDGNYEPSNCRWISHSKQQLNKNNNRIITYESKSMTISQWANELGVTFNLLYGRLNKYGNNLGEVIKSLN